MLSNKYHGYYWNVYVNKCHYEAVNIHVLKPQLELSS